MASTFFGLTIGYTGLVSANASLNTTGNNIANVETEGYSRQVATQQAANALKTGESYGMIGAGVETVSIDQVRNTYYDLKYWKNNTELGIFDIKKQYTSEIEAYFTDTDSVQGFNVIFSDMFSALDEVRKSSGDNTVKEEFMSQCQSMCDYFNSMYTNLQKVQLDANDEIQNKVNEINALASELATINKQINTVEINGVTANELRDKRNLLIDQLSLIVDVNVEETPIYTDEGGTIKSGINRYTVRIAGGQTLVNGYEYNTLSCVARESKLNESDADGLYELKWSNGLDFNLYGGNLGGELKGLIEVRDGNNAEYFHGQVTATGTKDITDSEGNTKTVNTITIPAGYDYMTDLNKLTIPEYGEIQVGVNIVNYSGWEYNEATKEYTLYVDEDLSGSEGKTAQVGRSVDYQGIPYYMSQLNEWCRSFTQAMNRIELEAQDDYGNDAQVLFTATNITDHNNNYYFNDYYNDSSVIYSKGDNYQKVTAQTIGVNSNMVYDLNLFGTTSDITKGQDAQDITEKLLSVKVDKAKMSFRGCTAGEFLQCITTDTALNASNAENFYKNYDKISASIANQRLSEMGVDNDEEALNLVKFQEAYNLAAKMIQVMSEIYDQLIQRTGV